MKVWQRNVKRGARIMCSTFLWCPKVSYDVRPVFQYMMNAMATDSHSMEDRRHSHRRHGRHGETLAAEWSPAMPLMPSMPLMAVFDQYSNGSDHRFIHSNIIYYYIIGLLSNANGCDVCDANDARDGCDCDTDRCIALNIADQHCDQYCWDSMETQMEIHCKSWALKH